MAQHSYVINGAGQDPVFRGLLGEKQFSSEESLIRQIKKIENQLHLKGFIEAQLIDVTKDSLQLNKEFILVLGPQYKWGELTFIPPDLGFTNPRKIKGYAGKPINKPSVEKTLLNYLKEFGNQGYPFATAEFFQTVIIDSTIESNVKINSGPLVLIDTIINVGDAKLTPGLLENASGIKSGDLHNDKAISNIRKRLNSMGFVYMAQDPKVFFHEEGTRVYINANKRNANSFSALLGLLPQGKNGSLTVVGDASIMLMNAFNVGESFNFEFNKNALQNTALESHIEFPFLFNPKTSFEGDFTLIKQDTLYLEAQFSTTLSLRTTSFSRVGFHYQKMNSRVLVEDDNGNGDFSTNYYGAKYNYQNLDNAYNPRSGNVITTTFGYGAKQLSDQNELEERIPQKKITLKSVSHLNISKRVTLVLETSGGYLGSDTLLLNEYFRIGGNNELKGFDEKSIFANRYLIGAVTFKYFLQKTSSINLFVNQGILENNFQIDPIDYPIGFGVGFQLPIPSGFFKISYALGRQYNNPVIFENGKIHFSLVNLF